MSDFNFCRGRQWQTTSERRLTWKPYRVRISQRWLDGIFHFHFDFAPPTLQVKGENDTSKKLHVYSNILRNGSFSPWKTRGCSEFFSQVQFEVYYRYISVNHQSLIYQGTAARPQANVDTVTESQGIKTQYLCFSCDYCWTFFTTCLVKFECKEMQQIHNTVNWKIWNRPDFFFFTANPKFILDYTLINGDDQCWDFDVAASTPRLPFSTQLPAQVPLKPTELPTWDSTPSMNQTLVPQNVQSTQQSFCRSPLQSQADWVAFVQQQRLVDWALSNTPSRTPAIYWSLHVSKSCWTASRLPDFQDVKPFLERKGPECYDSQTTAWPKALSPCTSKKKSNTKLLKKKNH